MPARGLEPPTNRVKQTASAPPLSGRASNYLFPNRTCDFHRIRLSKVSLSRIVPLIELLLLHLFPLYRTLLRSFEYYRCSVTMRHTPFR